MIKEQVTTLEKFQRLRARRGKCPTIEPSIGNGVTPQQFVKVVGALAQGTAHGTVLRRLQKEE